MGRKQTRLKPPKPTAADKMFTVAAAIEKVLASDESPVNVRDLACEMMNICGGATGLAKMIEDEYKEAKPGSPSRARLLSLKTHLVTIATSQESRGDLGHLSDEDLYATAQRMITRAGIQSRTVQDLEIEIRNLKRKMAKMVPANQEWVDHYCI